MKIILEIVGLLLMSVHPNFKIVGIVISLLTLIIYISRADTKKSAQRQMSQQEKKILERDDFLAEREYQRGLDERKRQEVREDRTERNRLKHEKEMEQIRATPVATPVAHLTTSVRRQRVAELTSEGLSNEEIADLFNVSLRTIQRDAKTPNPASNGHATGEGEPK